MAYQRITRPPKDKHFTSELQARILEVLPIDQGTGYSHGHAISPTEILKRLGVEKPTMAQRASVSRSLSRLLSRGLVIKYEAATYAWQGHANSGKYTKVYFHIENK
jgi:DNA-binding MarR family transcriptional regulator